jgi:CheY-like chemotaxis protein
MSSPPRIVVADDDRAMRVLFSVMLAKGGYEIDAAPNGREVLRLLNAEPIDLVLLDLQMPELNGFATLTEIRANPRLVRLPVLATSAYGHHSRDSVCAAGFDYYLQKPVDRLELLRVIASFLGPPTLPD